MEQHLIDIQNIIELFGEEPGFWEFVRQIAEEKNIDETDALEIASEVRERLKEIILEMPIAARKVNASCDRLATTTSKGERMYLYICSNCNDYIETPNGEEKFKFCPHCSAQYDELNII